MMLILDAWAMALGAAQGFDVDAATRAYLDSLQGAARARSDAYFEGGCWLILWSALVAILVNWVMLRTRWSAAWSERAAAETSRWKHVAQHAKQRPLV